MYNDSINGRSRDSLRSSSLWTVDKLMANSPKKYQASLLDTPQSYPDNSPAAGKTTADQVMSCRGMEAGRLVLILRRLGIFPGRHRDRNSERGLS